MNFQFNLHITGLQIVRTVVFVPSSLNLETQKFFPQYPLKHNEHQTQTLSKRIQNKPFKFSDYLWDNLILENVAMYREMAPFSKVCEYYIHLAIWFGQSID